MFQFPKWGEAVARSVSSYYAHFCAYSGAILCPGFSESKPQRKILRDRVLQLTDDLGNPGGLQWELVGTLALAWIICYGCIWKGTGHNKKL